MPGSLSLAELNYRNNPGRIQWIYLGILSTDQTMGQRRKSQKHSYDQRG